MKADTKREHPRIPFETRFTGEGPSFYFSDYSCDISENGMGIHTIRSLEIGQELRLQFQLPDGQQVEIEGRVVWNGESPETLRRCGLEFVNNEEPVRSRLREFIAFKIQGGVGG